MNTVRTALAAAAIITATLGGAYLATDAHADPAPAPTQSHSTRVCARAAFLADDYAHTHTGGRAERRAVAACAALAQGF